MSLTLEDNHEAVGGDIDDEEGSIYGSDTEDQPQMEMDYDQDTEVRPRVHDNFKDLIRGVITQLKHWACQEDKGDDTAEWAMSPGCVDLLQRVDVEFLVDLFMPGVPEDVQSLFLKNTWTLPDLLALPEVTDHDHRKGVSANFVHGKLRNRTPWTATAMWNRLENFPVEGFSTARKLGKRRNKDMSEASIIDKSAEMGSSQISGSSQPFKTALQRDTLPCSKAYL